MKTAKWQKLICALLCFVMCLSMIPTTASATEILPEISITSDTTAVTTGVLPDFTVSTTTEHVTIDSYYCNWARRDLSDQNWDGWGGSTPIAYNDGETHYGLSIKINVDSGYAIGSTTKIIFNGNDVTSSGFTDLTPWSWGGYIDIDLGLATGENPVTHTVRFETNGGGTIWNQTILDGETASKPSDPTKNAYTFAGWYTDSEFQNAFSFSTPVTSDLTLYAKWTPKTVLSEVRITSTTTSVSEGTLPTVTASTTTAHISITKVGWAWKNANSTNWNGWGYNTPTAVSDGTHYGIAIDISFDDGYAFDNTTKIIFNGTDVTSSGYTGFFPSNWSHFYIDLGTTTGGVSHAVTFVTNGGSAVAGQTVMEGATVEEPEDPTRDGYYLVGWYTDSVLQHAYDFSSAVTSDLTLYAKWAQSCTLSEIRITGDTTSVTAGTLSAFTAASSTAQVDYIENYGTNTHWVYWDNNTWYGFGYDTPTAVNDNVTHYALSLAVHLQAGCTFDDNTKIYYNGVDVTSSGHTGIQTISEWGGYVHIDLGQATGTRSYIVNFNMNGSPNWGPSSQTILTGGTVTKPEDPTWGFHDFAGWYTDKACTDGSEYDFSAPVASELTLYAKWTTCTLHLYAPIGGGVSLNGVSWAAECSYNDRANATVTVYARAHDGYHFKEWQYESGPVASTDPTYTFTMNVADRNLYAIFESDSIEGSATIPQGIYYMAGSTMTADVSGVTTPSENGVFRYQWQSSADKETWTDIAGAAEQTLTAPEADADQYFRVKVTADGYSGELYSATVLVHARHTITLTNCKAYYGAWTSTTQASAGTKITLKANAAPDGMQFEKWIVTGATLDDETAETAHFTMPGNAVTAEAVYISSAPITQFVTHLYRYGLGREPDESGLNAWVKAIEEKQFTGKQAAFYFIFSSEFMVKNYCNRCFVTVLYRTCMNREPDTGGLNAWVSALDNGMLRTDALNYFMEAEPHEFETLCESYGITPGGWVDGTCPAFGVSGKCSGCGKCITHTPEAVAAVAPTCTVEGNEAYYVCTVCGKCFSDADCTTEITKESRTVPAAGHSFTTRTVKNTGTDESPVWIEETTCEKCGATSVTDGKILQFVVRLYKYCLNREPDLTGLQAWVSFLEEGKTTGKGAAFAFFFSDENIYQNNYCNTCFVRTLYLACLNREPDPSGWDAWVTVLNNGMSRTDAVNYFMEAEPHEFEKLCEDCGITPGGWVSGTYPAFGVTGTCGYCGNPIG